MSFPWIVKGDKTSHGGTVIEGDTAFDTHGKPVALVGHLTTCPKCKGGPFPILTGAPDFVCNGRPVARHGDVTSCGASLIGSQASSWWTSAEKASGIKSAPTSAEKYTFGMLNYDEHFVLLDKEANRPIEGFSYGIVTPTGAQEGLSDADGKTICTESPVPETISLAYAVQLQIGVRR